MALRYRLNGDLLCAAKSPELADDTYIDDGLHYMLSVIQRVVIPEADEGTSGRWHWRRRGEPFRALPGDTPAEAVVQFGDER